MFCWELATQLERDVLPATRAAGIKTFAIGIGSADSAKTFSERTGFPAECLFADASDESDAYAAVGTRNTQRDTKGKQIFEGVASMWSERTNDAIKRRGRDDLNGILKLYKPLMPRGPKAMEQSFVQGATLIFDGSTELFSHYDYSSGDHADLNEVVRVATTRQAFGLPR